MNERIYYSHDAEMRATRDRALTVLIFVAVGLGIGAVLALLLAPKAGDQTRHELASAFSDGINEGREQSAGTLRRLEHDFGDLRKKVEDRMGDLR